jgi:hypothetical protein
MITPGTGRVMGGAMAGAPLLNRAIEETPDRRAAGRAAIIHL